MHTTDLSHFQHNHSFGQDRVRVGERRTYLVIALTAVMMVVEIACGIRYGSMALLADGLHMASHAAALVIVALAYVYARRRAHDDRFAFGTGKVNALAGFAGAILLSVFALMMAVESGARLLSPVPIDFNQAALVAGVGLLVNVVSAVILLGGSAGEHAPKGEHAHDHGHAHGHAHAHGHGHAHGSGEDHNLRAAYLHVLADAVTSVAALLALVGGKFWGANWLDPTMGVVGAILVARWSWGLMRDSSGVLLDHQAPAEIRDRIRLSLERDSEDRVADLHVWSIGPGLHAAEIAIVTHEPASPDHYKSLLPQDARLVHTTIEVHRCQDGARDHTH